MLLRSNNKELSVCIYEKAYFIVNIKNQELYLESFVENQMEEENDLEWIH